MRIIIEVEPGTKVTGITSDGGAPGGVQDAVDTGPPRLGSARTRALRLLHDQVQDGLVTTGIERADPLEAASDHHLGERHGDRRTGAASP